MKKTETILIVDNDSKSRDLISAFLTYKGYDTIVPRGNSSVFETVKEENAGIVIAEPGSIGSSPEKFYEELKKTEPLAALLLCSPPDAPLHFKPDNEQTFIIKKPIDLENLESIVNRTLEHQSLKLQNLNTLQSIKSHTFSPNMIGKSRVMLSLFDTIKKVASSNATVLIQGESGTGKELAARAIHQLSDRKNRNFVPFNCAAIPDELLESELFGHVKGSFTGAYANRAGRFEMADRGTLFLDEIGDMKANLQVKLLRVLQSREFEPVGSTKSQKVDVRIIAATNRKLEEMVESRDFREDLYYRLSVIPITIPPLRERKDDILLLVNNFLLNFKDERKEGVLGFSDECIEILSNYDWPGNVRELENLVERMVILKDRGLITPEDLPEKYLLPNDRSRMNPFPAQEAAVDFPDEGICLNTAVDRFENRLILMALERTNWNKKEAAMLLNLKRTTLIEKLKKKNLHFGGKRECYDNQSN